jgi:hypothetical protein
MQPAAFINSYHLVFCFNQSWSLPVTLMNKCSYKNVQETFHLPVIPFNKTCLLVQQKRSHLKVPGSEERTERNFKFKMYYHKF